jgi:hypothetical protein
VKKRSPISGGYHTADKSVSEIVTPLAQELVEKKLNFPKTVIFCKLDVCGKGFEMAQRIIRKAIMNGITDLNTHLISQYHAACTEEVHSIEFEFKLHYDYSNDNCYFIQTCNVCDVFFV